MNKVAIAYSTKDRVEKSERTLMPLLNDCDDERFDLWWFDGSKTEDGKDFYSGTQALEGIPGATLTGGADRYIVYALTTLIEKGYDFVGLVENDVLLDADWFEPTMELFKKYKNVGAVSARCYKDRILIQRDDHALMHNLGAGMVVFSRDAVWHILRSYRTGFSSENRRVFALLSGIDIGAYWAFGGSDHMLVCDWQWDRVLASYGLLSLALTPAKAVMLEDIEAQGLELAAGPVEERRDDKAFATYMKRTEYCHYDDWRFRELAGLLVKDGVYSYFAHQLPMLGATYAGGWRHRWAQGFGPFVWKAGSGATLEVPLQGPCELLVSGGEHGSQVTVTDENGFHIAPKLYPEGSDGQVLALTLPTAFAYRKVKVVAEPGACVFGIKARMPQPVSRGVKFDFHTLPPLED